MNGCRTEAGARAYGCGEIKGYPRDDDIHIIV